MNPPTAKITIKVKPMAIPLTTFDSADGVSSPESSTVSDGFGGNGRLLVVL